MQKMMEELSQLYKALMDSAADAIIVIDTAGLIRHFSLSAESLFGHAASDCIGQNIKMLMPEPYRSEHDGYLQGYHRTGKASIIGAGRDVTGLHRDGRTFPMHLSVGKAQFKKQTYYIGICHDLSDYKKTLSEKLHIESLQNALFDAAVDGIITIDKIGTIASFNKAAEKLFGYAKQEIVGKNVRTLMPSPYQESHDNYLSNYAHGGKAQVIGIGRDVPGLRKDGSIFPMRLSVGKASTEQGEMYIGMCHDLTEYQNALLGLANAEQRYKSIVECQGQIICRLDRDYRLVFANHSFQKIFECSEQEIMGMHFVNFIPGDKGEMQQILNEVIQGDSNHQVYFKTLMLRKSGVFNIEWWFTKVTVESGCTEIQGFGIDISEKENALREAAFLKNHDVLTGLLNSDSFFAAFENWHKAERYAVFYVDCNHFGLINNRYGFEFGDQMLVEASHRLKRAIKLPALFCRPGADEFAVVVEVTDSLDASNIAADIIEHLEEPYLLLNETIRLSCKVGIAIYPEDSAQFSNVLRMAESVLTKSKNSQLHIAFFDKQYHSGLQRQLDVEQRLRQALVQKTLKVFLQPKVELASRKVLSYEALLRWNDAVLGMVSPVEFIKVAEQLSLAKVIDRYVLTTVFQSLRSCLEQHTKVLPIAVNITSSHFADLALSDFILQLAETYQVPLNLLELEVTEGVLLEMTPEVQTNLEILRSKKIKVSIDDFGTGFSSLSYIRKLTVDAIKIDKSFVDDVTDDTGEQLIAAVIAIAKAVKLDVVAEGVETAEQARVLQRLGCHTGQGYLFARPAAINEVLSCAAL